MRRGGHHVFERLIAQCEAYAPVRVDIPPEEDGIFIGLELPDPPQSTDDDED